MREGVREARKGRGVGNNNVLARSGLRQVKEREKIMNTLCLQTACQRLDRVISCEAGANE